MLFISTGLRGVDFGDKGVKEFMASVASEKDGGKIELRLDGPEGALVGTCEVAATGGVQTWSTASCKVEKVTGVHDLYLVFTGAEGELFNFDYW